MEVGKVKGSIVALVTPFNVDGSLDLEALKKLVEWQISSGTAAIVPCGTTGEASTLSDEEYEQVVGTVVQVAAKRVPIIAGAGSNSTAKAVALGGIAKKCGVDALLVVSPYYNRPTVDGLFQHYRAIAEGAKLPILLYNVPGRTGSNLSPQTILKIAEIDEVYGVKESSGSITQAMEIIEKRRDGFLLYSGDDVLALATIAAGAEGVISVAANQIPKALADLTAAALSGDFKKAREIHYRFRELMDVNFIESNPIPVKYILSKMGKIKEAYRLPLVPLTSENKRVIDGMISKWSLIS